MKRRPDRCQLRLITKISVTPLLNLFFVLLLAFMVAVPLMKNEASLASSAAGASASEIPPKRVVTLTLDEARSLTLDGRRVERTELTAALNQLVKAQPDTAVMVQMHHALPVESLVEIMDELNDAGVRKTSVVATQTAHQ